MEFVKLNNLNATESNQTNKALEKAIDNLDQQFIEDWLLNDERDYYLSNSHKKKLILLLVEFLDQPLRIEALQSIYSILLNSDNINDLSKVLIQRSNDFNKLVVLKGKIDYLKYQSNKKPETEEPKQNVTIE